ncbi:hypothetical protein H257_13272 [Aphanomyces astaci]|uniref:Uncharacterized protein n=1 Tax=Aphanomyces astaci TaxID=112090 RepID=W4FWQ7_APHAT|nr:hypothetical protein H257_13272 [Aphanomyces astaci]ETV71376.1 hypothetical protein H257_13272 [Aphanomyces astaci]|eukprot:XP_009839041.1 hypothetical protein H257_13272 [Aphanomyces astaci]
MTNTVVCKSCQSTWELDLPGVGVRQICICTLCSAQSRGTSSHPDAVGRMRQVYEEGQADMDIAAADDDDGATMITDISCSISQHFAPHDDTSDAYINTNPVNAVTRDQPPDRGLVNRPDDGVSTDPNVLSSSSEHRSRRPSFPPYLLEHGGRTSGGGTTSATHMPLPSVLVPRLPKQHHQQQVHPHVHLSSSSLAYQYGGGGAPDTHDDVISLGSEERFSLHSSRQYNHHHHDRVSAAALLGSVRLGGGMPEIDHEDHHSSSHVHSQHRMSPPRPSYDASVDNLVNPSTWKSHHHQHHHYPTTANAARIEIASNHRFG